MADLHVVSELTGLQSLTLRGPKPVELRMLTPLQRLESLEIVFGRIDGPLGLLAHLPNLTYVTCEGWPKRRPWNSY